MDEKILIAKRVALELRDGTLVNLGIGLPTQVAAYVPKHIQVFFQSENGIVGMLSLPEEGLEDEDLTDAGGRPIGALPGAATFDSAMSFGLIRGGHLDLCVLGAFQVAENGDLANWATSENDTTPAVGGAMDLAAGARCYAEAAEAGHREGMHNWGVMLVKGIGVEADEGAGQDWIARARAAREAAAGAAQSA